MSGGHFEYMNDCLNSELLRHGTDPLEDRQLSECLFDMMKLVHEYDWFVSSDTDVVDWNKAADAFKRKWLKHPVFSKRRCANCKWLVRGRCHEAHYGDKPRKMEEPRFNECDDGSFKLKGKRK